MSDSESCSVPQFATPTPIRVVPDRPVAEEADVPVAPEPDADTERYPGTLKLVRERIHAAREIMHAARERADRELVEAGRVILAREFNDDVATYRAYGAQRGVFERLGGDLERAPTTVRSWVEAAIVDDRLRQKDIQAPENPLSMTHLVVLAKLDADEDAQVEVAQQCVEHGWRTRALEEKVDAKRAQLNLKSRRKRRRSKGDCEEAPRLPGREPTPEDFQAVYEVVMDRLVGRADSDRSAAVEAMFETVKRRLDQDQGVQATRAMTALHSEFSRVYNRVNRSRAAEGRTDTFRAVVGPGPLVTVTLGSWKRCCEPETLRKALEAIADVADSPNEQVVAELTEPTGTLSDKLREVRDAVERAAEGTWK